MVRSVTALLLLTMVAAPAAGQSVAGTNDWRFRDVSFQTPERQPPSIDVGSYGRLGLGMFGLKSETPRSRAVTGRDLSAPRQRRAGVGWSLKF